MKMWSNLQPAGLQTPNVCQSISAGKGLFKASTTDGKTPLCVYLIGSSEEWFACVHLDQYTAQTPHVDSQVVRDS